MDSLKGSGCLRGVGLSQMGKATKGRLLCACFSCRAHFAAERILLQSVSLIVNAGKGVQVLDGKWYGSGVLNYGSHPKLRQYAGDFEKSL
jgi:hypothetical protein